MRACACASREQCLDDLGRDRRVVVSDATSESKLNGRRRRFAMQRHHVVIAAAAIAAFLTPFAVSVGLASGVDDPPVVEACYAKSGGWLHLGTAASCKSDERPVRWSLVGPQGPQGTQGPQGPQGREGPAGAPGTS